MIKKYSNRSLPSVQLNGESQQKEATEKAWYEDFLSNLQKTQMAQAQQRSISDEISAIMGNPRPKHSSVEEAVLDMQERTGLRQYLAQKEALAFIQEPEIFAKVPQMKVFIDNFVKDRPGTSVESVVHDLLKIDEIRDAIENRSDVDDEIRSYINKQIAESKSNTHEHGHVDMNFGKVDQSSADTSDDPLAICEPMRRD